MLVLSVTCLLLSYGWNTASAQSSTCSQRYDDAKNLFDNGDRNGCINILRSALDSCRKEKEQAGRLLFLKALAEAGEDSVDLMRADLERLFRNDRHHVIKPYDPLMKGKPGEADLFGAWEELQHALRSDLGRWRIGVHGALLKTVPRVTTDLTVHAGDNAMEYSAPFGWEVGASMDLELIPDLALKGSAGYASVGYTAHNNAIDYSERITLLPFSLGLKKQVQMERSAYVPFGTISMGTSWLIGANAEISREEGLDTRYLRSFTTDRLAERRQRQYGLEGSVGLSRKLGSTIFSGELGYRYALTTLTSDEGPYTNNDLLAGYYYVDNETFLNAVVLRLSVMYIAAYHRKNRLHP